MKEFVDGLRKKFSEELGRTSGEYLKTGLDMFHNCREKESEYGQAAVGNMTVALELMLKSYIAVKSLSSIFRDLPPEMRVFLSNPESVPRFFKWRNYDIDIRSDKYKTLDLNECFDVFYMLFPHMKQTLMPHIALLTRWRHPSLHGIMPDLNRYEFERIGYAVLSIAEALRGDKSYDFPWYSLSEYDTEFMRIFDTQRMERVEHALKQASSMAKEITGDSLRTVVAHNWDTFVTVCPVCRASGLLKGYTELAVGEDEDGPYPNLDFFATTFRCEECELILYDSEELHLANMNTLYDRSNEIEKWFMEHRNNMDWYMG